MTRLALAFVALLLVIAAARHATRRQPIPARWEEPDDGVQPADEYPWRVLWGAA